VLPNPHRKEPIVLAHKINTRKKFYEKESIILALFICKMGGGEKSGQTTNVGGGWGESADISLLPNQRRRKIAVF